MDVKTIQTLKTLNEEVVENQLDVDQWATLLKKRVTDQEFALVKEAMSSGTLYIRKKEYRDIAVGAYPFMGNSTLIGDDGKTVTFTPWIEKIQSQGVTRPNDIVHLDRIVRLIDNPAAKELFGF